MTSSVPWQVAGVRPQALETARKAARRSGKSVAEWLDTMILEQARNEGAAPGRAPDDDPRHPGASRETAGSDFEHEPQRPTSGSSAERRPPRPPPPHLAAVHHPP